VSPVLRNVDRFASTECRQLRVGQLVRMPIQYLGPLDRDGCKPMIHSRESWIIESFPGRGEYAYCGTPDRTWRERANNNMHCVNLTRLSDQSRLRLAQHWVAPYVDPSEG